MQGSKPAWGLGFDKGCTLGYKRPENMVLRPSGYTGVSQHPPLDVSSEVGLREARARASVVSFRLSADRCSLSDHGLMMWCRMCSSMHQELVRMMRHMCRQMRYSGERRAVCDFECFVLYFSHVFNHILDKRKFVFY